MKTIKSIFTLSALLLFLSVAGCYAPPPPPPYPVYYRGATFYGPYHYGRCGMYCSNGWCTRHCVVH